MSSLTPPKFTFVRNQDKDFTTYMIQSDGDTVVVTAEGMIMDINPVSTLPDQYAQWSSQFLQAFEDFKESKDVLA